MRLAQPDIGQPATDAAALLDAGRCHVCGHALQGLPTRGTCPECGTPYTEQSALQLKPWPSAFLSVAWLAWPIAGLAAAVAFMMIDASIRDMTMPAWLSVPVVWLGLVFAFMVPVNCHQLFRRTLQRALPEHTRTRGGVLVLRRIGTAVVVVLGLALVAAYYLFSCMYGFSRMSEI